MFREMTILSVAVLAGVLAGCGERTPTPRRALADLDPTRRMEFAAACTNAIKAFPDLDMAAVTMTVRTNETGGIEARIVGSDSVPVQTLGRNVAVAVTNLAMSYPEIFYRRESGSPNVWQVIVPGSQEVEAEGIFAVKVK